MAQSTASFFTDPTDVQTALGEHCQVGFVVTGRGPFRARLIRITLTRLSLLSAEEWQSRVLFVRPPADRVIVLLPWGCEPSQRWAGIPLRPQEVLTIRSVPGVHGRTVDHCHSAAVVCSTDYLVRLGRRLVGPTFVVPPGVARWQPAPDALRALVGLFRAAIRVTASRLSAPTSPEAARGLEQEMVGALAECLSIAPEEPHRQREQSQISLMARFAEILCLHSERLPSSADLSRQLGVPARTLRGYCHDHLGVAPGRYLQLYQLQQFRRGLRGADPGVTTVSALARRHGIRQTSRLARSYRDLFGEPPSATLRHTAES
jgi:AraC-like DNA-binding protein